MNWGGGTYPPPAARSPVPPSHPSPMQHPGSTSPACARMARPTGHTYSGQASGSWLSRPSCPHALLRGSPPPACASRLTSSHPPVSTESRALGGQEGRDVDEALRAAVIPPRRAGGPLHDHGPKGVAEAGVREAGAAAAPPRGARGRG